MPTAVARVPALSPSLMTTSSQWIGRRRHWTRFILQLVLGPSFFQILEATRDLFFFFFFPSSSRSKKFLCSLCSLFCPLLFVLRYNNHNNHKTTGSLFCFFLAKTTTITAKSLRLSSAALAPPSSSSPTRRLRSFLPAGVNFFIPATLLLSPPAFFLLPTRPLLPRSQPPLVFSNQASSPRHQACFSSHQVSLFRFVTAPPLLPASIPFFLAGLPFLFTKPLHPFFAPKHDYHHA
ncbi:hypothetical protein QBC42DRAFT_90409 [Cladorrhinum samala]|uniref:Transmembrane protein n=1 Tax=Cladorrhinum samala TaxID=585594 RepID=A0AAV9HZ84_9PEZI|nr:hypothetical protein QBC42DRAFT_90409 [Cladorrhinum samala]